jgi:hypothetical protein
VIPVFIFARDRGLVERIAQELGVEGRARILTSPDDLSGRDQAIIIRDTVTCRHHPFARQIEPYLADMVAEGDALLWDLDVDWLVSGVRVRGPRVRIEGHRPPPPPPVPDTPRNERRRERAAQLEIAPCEPWPTVGSRRKKR